MAVTTTNLGVITAYGDAVAAGYTGTKAEWQALMASYATVAEEANEAKNAAVSAKDTAVAKATEATTAAATANTAKDTATSKATEATTAANTATTKAGEASASAQSIAQSASQIQKNTDDIDQLKSELEVTSSYDITWSQGGINNSGTAVSRTNRIRTDYITIENDSIFVEIPAGFKYAIHAYNSSKTRIGYIPSGSDIMTDRKATYKVSDSYDNAVYFRMWVAYTDDSDILPAEGANVTVAPYESVIDTLKSHVLKSVRILGVGNSYTRDSIRWLCKILKESGYEDVVVGHGYLGASTLAEQYASLDSSDSNHSAFEYWKYSNAKNAVKTSGKTLDEIFADEPWDIVVFQQQSDESGQYASYVSSSFDINDFIAYIAGKVSNANLKFALMMPWSHADGYTSTKFAEYYNSDPEAMLDAIKSVIPQVADHMSQCDYVVNAGEAIDLGRQNSYLNALGDQMLRTDKNHLYYGIPSYMVGLVYALTLCDVNLNNVMWYPTATDEGQTGIITSGYLAYLAKQCAFTAVNGYALADDISELKEDFATMQSDGAVPSAEQILSDKGVTDSVPYHYRKTGGDGADRLYDQIVGETVCWNQLVSNNVIHGTINSGMPATDLQSAQLKANHKYLYQLNLSRQSTGGIQNVDFQIALRFFGGATTIYHFDQSSKPHVVTVDSTQFSSLTVYTYSDTFGDDVTYALNVFDLTAMFGSTIADYIYQLEQTTAGAGVAFFKSLFPNNYYPYNAGELVSVSGLSAHKMVGFNQWDGTYTANTWLSATDGTTAAQSGYNLTDFIRVFQNTEYHVTNSGSGRFLFYDSEKVALSGQAWASNSSERILTTPAGASYVRFTITTVNLSGFMFNLSDPAKNGTYEPYQKHSYPLDSTLTLRGLFKLDANNNLYADGDTYDADGTVTRRYGVVDLGTLNWIANSEENSIFTTNIPNMAVVSNTDYTKRNEGAICSKYQPSSSISVSANMDDKAWLRLLNSIYIRDTSYTDATTFKTAMSGVMLVYELATPTTEEADPYQHLQQCDPNGTEEYVSTGIVPIGHNSFYPENLRAKVEQLPWNFASLIAPTESTFTATRNYTTGSLFIVDNVLYKATSNIANGGTITPNTNCTATTLAEIISALA